MYKLIFIGLVVMVGVLVIGLALNMSGHAHIGASLDVELAVRNGSAAVNSLCNVADALCK